MFQKGCTRDVNDLCKDDDVTCRPHRASRMMTPHDIDAALISTI